MKINNLGKFLSLVVLFAPIHSLAESFGKVHCIGDSLTVGAGDGTRGGGYRWYLKDRLAARGYTLNFVGTSTEHPGGLTDKEHDGHGGWSTQDLINGREDFGNIDSWLLSQQPNAIVLMIGRNDPWPWDTAYTDYSNLANRIFTNCPNVTLYWSNVILPLNQDSGETLHCELDDAAIQTVVIQQRMLGRNVKYIDSYRALRGRFDIFSDGVHLNDLGYNLFAQGIEQKMVRSPLRLSSPIAH